MAAAEVGGANRDGWRVVWTAFVVAVFGWGIGFSGPGVYVAALHRIHGWPISAISLAVTGHFLVSAALIGCLPDAYRRYGVARVTIVGALLAAAGAVAWTNALQVWQLVPALMLSGAGWSAMSGAALNAMVAPWFERDRPKGGLSLAGSLVALATIVLVCPLVWRFLRPAPAGAPKAEAPLPRRALLARWSFVTMSSAFALGMFAQIGLFAHLMARLEPDFGPVMAAFAISLVALCAVLGRTLLGWLLGEHDRRLAAAANFLMQAAGSILLALGDGMVPLAIGCVLFGLGVGNLNSLPPLIAQREFRAADVGTVVALTIAINQAVFAFAPAILGALRDLSGSYVMAFLVVATLQGLAAATVALGRRFS
jgi:MFS family permease